MKSVYEVLFEAVLPVLAKIHIEAENEWEASALAERISASQKPGVKSAESGRCSPLIQKRPRGVTISVAHHA